MKKPFKNTKLGKFLRGFVREVPLVGGLKDHAQSEDPRDGGEKGKLDKSELMGQLVAAGLVIVPILKTLDLLPAPIAELIEQILTHIQP
jgi:hypothetical protein